MVYNGPVPILRHIERDNSIKTIIVNTGPICDWIDTIASWLAHDLTRQCDIIAGTKIAEVGDDGEDGEVVVLDGGYTSSQVIHYLSAAYSFV